MKDVIDEDQRFALLQNIFANKILPLLEEYFFEDWTKIRLVLGDDNKAAEHNKKTFYLRLITPNGECFSDKMNGGGTLKDHDGNIVKYTLSKTLLFENTNQWLSMVMPKGFNYSAGTYTLQIYCEGYDIGQDTFNVK